MAKERLVDVEIDARDLRKALRAFTPDVEKRTRKQMRDLARTVRDDARRHMERGPAQGGHMTSGVRSGADGIVPHVSRGAARFPYLEWMDHGGARPRDNSPRPFRKEGRYFFPAVGRSRKRVYREAERIIDEAVRAARLG